MNLAPIMANDGMGDYSTTTTGAPPPVPGAEDPGQPQRRGAGPLYIGQPTLKGPNLNDSYRYNQRDFYGQNPNITFTDPRGVQIYVPSFGEVPYAVMGSQLQQKKEERAQTKKALDDLLNPKFDRTAPQYEAEFAAYVGKSINDDISDLTASFGGDKSAALNWAAETNEGRAWWAQRNRVRNAVGAEAKYVADDWADILSQESKGLLYVSPEDKRIGEEVVRGYTALGTDKEPDLPDYLKTVNQGKRIIGRDQFVKNFIIPAIDELAQDTETIEKPYRIAGGRLVIPVTDKRNYDQMIEAEARAMTEADQFDHVDEARKWLTERFPADVKVQAIVRDPIQPSGGSSAAPKVAVGAVETGRSTGNIEEGPANPQFSPLDTGGPTLRRADVERKPVYEITGGKKVQMSPKNFVDLDGNPITMRPTYIVNDKGNLYAAGEIVGKGQTVTYTTMEENEDGEMEEVTKTVDTTKGIAPVTLPLKGNEATFAEVFGQDYAKGFSGAKQDSAKPSPEQFNTQWSKLPKGASLMGPDGKMYTKQ